MIYLIMIIAVLVIYGVFMTVMAIMNRNELAKWVENSDYWEKKYRERDTAYDNIFESLKTRSNDDFRKPEPGEIDAIIKHGSPKVRRDKLWSEG